MSGVPQLSPNIQNMLAQLAQRQANTQDLMQQQTGAMPYSIAPSGGIPKVQMGQGAAPTNGPAMPQTPTQQASVQVPQTAQAAALPQNNAPTTVGSGSSATLTPSAMVQNLQYYLQNGMMPTPGTGTSGSGQDTPTGDATGATGTVISQAMKITGVDSSWAPYLAALVQKENASGDPKATNPTAVDGEHATGFLQTLPSTFQANAAPGMTDISNPVDNAVAAINYIKSRYGSPANIPGLTSGNYKGY